MSLAYIFRAPAGTSESPDGTIGSALVAVLGELEGDAKAEARHGRADLGHERVKLGGGLAPYSTNMCWWARTSPNWSLVSGPAVVWKTRSSASGPWCDGGIRTRSALPYLVMKIDDGGDPHGETGAGLSGSTVRSERTRSPGQA